MVYAEMAPLQILQWLPFSGYFEIILRFIVNLTAFDMIPEVVRITLDKLVANLHILNKYFGFSSVGSLK